MPKASIIITTYNRPKLLRERSLQSAIEQNFDDYEILVVDHGSTVDYDIEDHQKLRWIKIPQNSGIVSTARNRGAREAKGEYIVFLDDDNELMPDFLKETVAALDEAKDMSAVSVGRKVLHFGYEHYAAPYRSDHRGHERFVSVDWGWLIRRSVFDVIQYDENLFFSEDGDFGLRFTERFAFMALDKPLTIAYAHEEGESHSTPNPKMIDSLGLYVKKNIRHYIGQPNELRHLYRLIGRRYYMGGYRAKGLLYFWKSFMAMKNFRTFKHLFYLLFGWRVYNWYMTKEEKRA